MFYCLFCDIIVMFDWILSLFYHPTQKLIIIRSYTNNNNVWRCSNHCLLPIGHNCQTQLLIGCWYYLNNMVSMQVITTQDDHLVWISFLCVMLSSGLSRQLLKSNLWAHSRFWEDDELTLISWFGHRATWSQESFLCCHEIKLGFELQT